MSTIQARVHRPSATGVIPSGGSLQWTPTRATITPGTPATLVLPSPFTVPLSGDVNTFTLAASGPDWAWQVRETFPGLETTTRLVAVPEAPDMVDYTTLLVVDPATLSPVQQPNVPIWYAYVDGVEAEAAASAASSDLSRVAAEGAQLAAEGSQTSAAASAATAATRAGEAATSATNASTSATSAGTQANTAAGHAGNALTYAQQASASEGAAAGSATTAQGHANAASTAATTASDQRALAVTARTGAETARTGAETAKDATVLAANGFTIGTVTTGEPGAQATAGITGTAPNRLLDLTLPRGLTGPATTLTVTDTVTGPETPGATGATGLKGDKGDPGGLVAGTVLGTADLNSFTTPGTYQQPTGANGTLARNYPKDILAGNMVVLSTVNPYITQVFYPANGAVLSKVFYVRHFNNAWQPWAAFASTRVDQGAGRAIYAWDDLNNREQLVWGDTGLRDITTLRDMTNTAGGVTEIRRVGNLVTLSLRAVSTNASGSIVILPPNAIPNFEPITGMADIRGVIVSAGGEARMLQIATSGELTIYAATAGNGYSGTVTWTTNRAWPTTLPGAAVGTVPNL